MRISLLHSRLVSFFLVLLSLTSSSLAGSEQQPLQSVQLPKPIYKAGQAIPVSCLNRTIASGEHVSDEKGQLQYIPFPACNETGKPLELQFGIERETNCTIPFISDEFFHLLEFYIHNDAPMTCRIPARPLASGAVDSKSTTGDYIPLIFALSGTLQLSHLHVSNNLNILLHATPRSISPGVIDSATAYSISPLTRNTRIVIGSALPLRLSVRWYPNTNLPSGWTGVGGHLFLSTLVYCLLCIGATAAASVAYFRGVEFPRKLRRYGADRLGGDSGRSTMGGYAYPSGNGLGHGWRGTGKMD